MTEATFSEYLKQLMIVQGFSLRRLAEKAGISTAGLHGILQNGNTPRIKTLKALGQALNVPTEVLASHLHCKGEGPTLPADLLAADESLLSFYRTKSENVSLVDARSFVEFCDCGELSGTELRSNVVRTISRPPFGDCDDLPLLAIVASGTAMEPEIHEQDILYLSPIFKDEDKNKLTPKTGDYVLAYAKKIDTPIVRVLIKSDLGEDWLFAENVNYPGEQKIPCERVLGIVVSKASRIRE